MPPIRVFVRKKPDRDSLQLFYDDPVTKREVSRSAGTSDRKEAERRARDWEIELQAFRGSDDAGWDWFKERFVREYCAGMSRVSRTPFVVALNHYKRLLNPSSAADATHESLGQFRANLLGEEMSPATVDKQLRHLLVALRWAESVKMIAAAPKVKTARQKKRRFMRGRPLTDAEFGAMLKNADAAFGEAHATAWRRFLELLDLSGFRIEEAMRLSWDTPPVLLRLDAKPFPMAMFYGAGDRGQKSDKDETWIVPPAFAKWLHQTPETEQHGLVAPVPGKRGEPLESPYEVSRAITRIGEAANVVVDTGQGNKYGSAHDIRRRFGTRWAMLVPPLVLKAMMRHGSIETTLKYYVGLDTDQIGAEIWKGVSPDLSPSKPASDEMRKSRKRK